MIIVIPYCVVWLILEGFLLRDYNPWWCFSASALWPVTLMMWISGYDFTPFRIVRDNDWFFELWEPQEVNSMDDEIPWSRKNEEQKYGEWSEFTGRFSGYLNHMPTYVEYCDRFDKEYGTVSA